MPISTKKFVLGKVFISHSSKDKPFVRRLAARLWKEGYQVWLDEKELVPGDALATRLSDALKDARVVIVVVTKASIHSKWLAFELNKATDRMVKGECRIIPVLKGAIDPPSDLAGLVYADFRRSFAKGFASIMAALETEATAALHGSWAELEALIEDVFDSNGFASITGGYISDDYDFVTLTGLVDSAHSEISEDGTVIYDVVHNYGDNEGLDERWWIEYREVQCRYGEIFHLVVTERSINIADVLPSSEFPKTSTSSMVQIRVGHFVLYLPSSKKQVNLPRSER